MISHDATLIVSALIEEGGRCELGDLERRVSPRLTHPFRGAWEILLDMQSVILQKGEGGQLHAVLETVQRPSAQPNKNPSIKNKANESLEATQPHEASVSPQLVKTLVARIINPRNFSAPYQAVVSGVKARRDPLLEYVESLSPIDRPDFWNAFMGLTDEEQADLRFAASRSDNRGRRN